MGDEGSIQSCFGQLLCRLSLTYSLQALGERTGSQAQIHGRLDETRTVISMEHYYNRSGHGAGRPRGLLGQDAGHNSGYGRTWRSTRRVLRFWKKRSF